MKWKYEDIVISILIVCFFLAFVVIVIQSYELQNLQQERDNYFKEAKAYSQLLNEYDIKCNECIRKVEQDYYEELIYSDDGLTLEHILYPRIEVLE